MDRVALGGKGGASSNTPVLLVRFLCSVDDIADSFFLLWKSSELEGLGMLESLAESQETRPVDPPLSWDSTGGGPDDCGEACLISQSS